MDRFAVFLWWSLRALHGKSPNTLMMCFSECCGGESHLRLLQSSGNQETRYYSNIYSCYDIHTTCSFTLKVLSIILRWNGYVKKQTFLISIIFLFFLYLHQSKWKKGTRSISCALWAEADGGLLDWCWYTSCGRTEGRWHVYHRQSTDLRTEYTRCRQTTGWVCFDATLTSSFCSSNICYLSADAEYMSMLLQKHTAFVRKISYHFISSIFHPVIPLTTCMCTDTNCL